MHWPSRQLLDAYRSGRIAQCVACSADRRASARRRSPTAGARFVLAHPGPPRPTCGPRRRSRSRRTARRSRGVPAGAHPDLLALERTAWRHRQAAHRGSRSTRCAARSGSSARPAGEAGWRVCIVDPADELTRPGRRRTRFSRCWRSRRRASLFLVVSRAPGRLLPTIRSRCRRLTLRPLGTADVVTARSQPSVAAPTRPTLRQAAARGRGSVAARSALERRSRNSPCATMATSSCSRRFPAPDPRALHALGDRLARADDDLFDDLHRAARNWGSASGPRAAAADARLGSPASRRRGKSLNARARRGDL